MNIENDTNISVMTGILGRIDKIPQGDGFLLECDIFVQKHLTSSLKKNRFRVVFFGEAAVEVDGNFFEGDYVSVLGELDECIFYRDGQTVREVRVAGRHMTNPELRMAP